MVSLQGLLSQGLISVKKVKNQLVNWSFTFQCVCCTRDKCRFVLWPMCAEKKGTFAVKVIIIWQSFFIACLAYTLIGPIIVVTFGVVRATVFLLALIDIWRLEETMSWFHADLLVVLVKQSSWMLDLWMWWMKSDLCKLFHLLPEWNQACSCRWNCHGYFDTLDCTGDTHQYLQRHWMVSVCGHQMMISKENSNSNTEYIGPCISI